MSDKTDAPIALEEVLISTNESPSPRIPKDENCTLFCPCKCCYAFTGIQVVACFNIFKVCCCRPCCHTPQRPTWNRKFELIVSSIRDSNNIMATIRSLRGVRLLADNTGYLNPTWSPMLPSGLSSKLGESLDVSNTLPGYEFIFHNNEGAPNFSVNDNRKFILYFHGGAFVFMNRATHRMFLYMMAKETGATILSIEYRRAPEFPYPIPHSDCFEAYKWLLQKLQNDSSRIFLGGDSAGGALAIDVIKETIKCGLPIPAAAILISPWVDYFDTTRSSLVENGPLDFLPTNMLCTVGGCYVDPSRAREVCPIYQDFSKFPPLLVEYGECEILRDQIVEFVANAKTQGLYVECNGYVDMVHVFQMLYMTDMAQCFDSFKKMKEFFERVPLLPQQPPTPSSLAQQPDPLVPQTPTVAVAPIDRVAPPAQEPPSAVSTTGRVPDSNADDAADTVASGDDRAPRAPGLTPEVSPAVAPGSTPGLTPALAPRLTPGLTSAAPSDGAAHTSVGHTVTTRDDRAPVVPGLTPGVREGAAAPATGDAI